MSSVSIDKCELFESRTYTWPSAGRISMFLKTISGAGMVLSGDTSVMKGGEVLGSGIVNLSNCYSCRPNII